MKNPYTEVFSAVRAWSGVVPSGFIASSSGSLSRIDRLYPGAYIEALKKKARVDYFERTTHPPKDRSDYYEAGAILHAVSRAEAGRFEMIELGAGTAPWTAMAACAAGHRGVSTRRFVAVEAEPTRFQWLTENLAKNGIQPFEYEAIRAVVFPSSKKDKTIYFPVGAPLFAGHTAQSLGQNVDEAARNRIINFADRMDDYTMEAAPVVSLVDILDSTKGRIFDMAHIDIQGAEADVIEDAAHLLSSRFRSIAIGTHGATIEERLQAVFSSLNWKLMIRFDHNSSFEVDGITVETKGLDGFQHWVNPSPAG